LYKDEYSRVADRYENIYKAVWTNFSYMTAIAGAVLAFSAGRLPLRLTLFLAGLPLAFWYLTTYLPLDRYGDGALDRLCTLERTFRCKFKANVRHFTAFRELKEDSTPCWLIVITAAAQLVGVWLVLQLKPDWGVILPFLMILPALIYARFLKLRV